MICETHSLNIDIDFVKKFYSSLGDDLSRRIFKARLVYGLTGDASGLIGDDPVNEERKIINAFLNNSSAKYYMWGSGRNAEWMRNWMVRSFPNLKFVAYIDRVPKQKELFGTKVISAVDFFLQNNEDSFVIINPEFYHKDIYKELLSHHIDENRILDIAALRIGLEQKQYFDKDILSHAGEEIFIDCGAYDGKTSLNFINWAGGNEMYKKIICFEPDENNLEICKRTLQQYHDITYIRKGLWDHTDILRFNTAQMSSAISNSGDIEIPVITIDEVCKDIPVTFIKMDIEGSELNALKGAQETIKNNKPKLAISIYHKTEDIFDIPKFISNLVPSYKYYIRHYCFYEDESVLYAV